MKHNLLEICYLIGSITFIVGLKMMGNAKTARKGNLIAAVGMTIAIVGTIFLHDNEVSGLVYGLIFGAIALGTVIGWFTAKKVQMTKMPELVSMFNGMGGACAALISIIEYNHLQHTMHNPIVGAAIVLSDSMDKLYGVLIAIIAGLIIGTVSFSGSIIAYLKLNGTMAKPIRIPSYNIINTMFMIGVLAFGTYIVFTGGILVGSAGTLLTLVMCKAMNRPLSNVIFGAFGGGTTSTDSGDQTKGSIKDVNVSDLAILLNYSKKVVIVPGYGLAVAQAQHIIHELELLLEERGVEVKYAIHPVAGRMPGHMNVLLAESNVSYDKLVEMDDINPEFDQTDVVLIVGANDVVNPAAKSDPSSPIYGMPILEVDHAKNIVVNKRSMNAGYAGIDNLLFYNPKCSMFFGDAKKALTNLVAEIKML